MRSILAIIAIFASFAAFAEDNKAVNELPMVAYIDQLNSKQAQIAVAVPNLAMVQKLASNFGVARPVVTKAQLLDMDDRTIVRSYLGTLTKQFGPSVLKTVLLNANLLDPAGESKYAATLRHAVKTGQLEVADILGA